ncbi:capsular polysaccharide transport system ATP-binding protein [Sphingobium sp. B7D2B]|uniref:ABC transporter ATP-binding protein n=1 Tax=Sphingobium sp. B7D2B TaxID=2940583 RepID=UPI00222590D4|nr:ABC transporter ATP-binding protein [Sphingobium sp. B7D2B]MCW2366820.1 capsular polysaccharide transport system ATP-binding protein [Sphingobium sp. B7D2B]
MIVVANVSKSYATRAGPRLILDQVNLTAKRGEKIGILGRNGSGKSTMIRMISGAEFPDKGRVTRTMTTSWPLAFSGAFQPALTGIDNLRFICRVYGVSVEDKVDQVDHFAELGRYLREPLRSYSAGMRARLAFALSMAIEFDCFLIDEIIAVGDARFHQKCHEELFEKRADRSMIIVSHDASYVREHCDRAAVLSQGRIHHFDAVDEAYEFYMASAS